LILSNDGPISKSFSWAMSLKNINFQLNILMKNDVNMDKINNIRISTKHTNKEEMGAKN
jgi:hypothetical protein